MNPLRYYLLGTGSWFIGFGIQSVVYAWLVTMVLRESPAMVGLAQMALLTPTLLLVLIGGGLADHFGGRRVAVLAQVSAALPPLCLALLIWFDNLSFATMIVYGLAMGSASAFLTPARDGLLNEVASGTIQQAVVLATMAQFIGQILGIVIASFADRWGAVLILSLQGLVFLLGALGFKRLPQPSDDRAAAHLPVLANLRRSILAGYRAVRDDPPMRITVLQNMAMGLFFMGSFIVTMPLLVREYYSGGATELSWTNGAFPVGLIVVVALMSRVRDLTRPGRALICAQGAGGLMLVFAGVGLPFEAFIALIVAWGGFGAIAMSMSRSIVQERAPVERRGQVMSFFTLSMMGAAPLGALLNGFLAGWIGPLLTLIVMGSLMFLTMLGVAVISNLWGLNSHSDPNWAPSVELRTGRCLKESGYSCSSNS